MVDLSGHVFFCLNFKTKYVMHSPSDELICRVCVCVIAFQTGKKSHELMHEISVCTDGSFSGQN